MNYPLILKYFKIEKAAYVTQVIVCFGYVTRVCFNDMLYIEYYNKVGAMSGSVLLLHTYLIILHLFIIA